MVDERSIRAHLMALRALLVGAEERCETLMRELREGGVDAAGADDEIRRLCESITDLSKLCSRLEQQIDTDG